MKKIASLTFLLFLPLLVSAQASVQAEKHYIYSIVTFDKEFDKENIKVKVDNGKSVDKLKNAEGKRITFKTPAAAFMYFISLGWEFYLNGATTSGGSYNGMGGSSTTSYWIFRRPCTKAEFEQTVKEGVEK